MLNSHSLPKEKLNNLKHLLNDNEEKLKKSIISRKKYLKSMDCKREMKPVTAITGIANGLISHWDKFSLSQLKDFTIAIAKNSDRLSNLITNVLDFAHLSHKDFNLDLSYINLNNLLMEKFKKYNEFEYINNEINLILDIDNQTNLKCDKYLINRLLDNLLLNIMDCTKLNYIKVSFDQLQSNVIMSSVNNRAYFQIEINYNKSANIPSIFYKIFNNKLFFQEANFKSFALEFNQDVDLILVKQIIRLHNGVISIKSFNKEIESLIIMLPV